MSTLNSSTLTKYMITLEKCGPIQVYVEGDLKCSPTSPVFLTIHGVGSSYQNWVRFTARECMKEVMEKVVVLHVSLPGQHPAAEDLDSAFPSLDLISLEMVTVLDTLGVKDRAVIVMGEGAGADIATRFAMYYPSRVWGVLLINSKGKKSVKGLDSCALNMKNVKRYDESYKKKGDWMIKSSVETLILVGAKTKAGSRSIAVKKSEDIMKMMRKGLCSIIRMSDVEDVLEEAPEKATYAIILFCQGLGLLPAMQRRLSQNNKGGVEYVQ